MLTLAELVALPKGQAFALLSRVGSCGSCACRCRMLVKTRSCRRAWPRSPTKWKDHITNDQWVPPARDLVARRSDL